jgi:uncharacterized protein (DUF2141 family)
MKSLLIAIILSMCAMNAMAQTNPVPFVDQPLVPASAAPGGSAFTLTVNGTGFVSGAVVQWNGSARSTKLVSSSKLTAQITAADIAAPGTATITALNPGAGAIPSNGVYFAVAVPLPNVGWMSNMDWGAGGNYNVVGDFNLDGKADVITSLYSMTSGAGEIMVLLGKGDGTFQPSQFYPAGEFSLSIVSGDFNGDGKLDVAVANASQQGTVSVLINKGGGVFGAPMTFPAGNSAVGLATADFNGDGKLDLAVSDLNGNAALVLLGNGDGTFKTPISSPVPSPDFLTAGDINGDGKQDLLVTSSISPQIAVLLGNGDGTFQAPLTNNVAAVSAAALADFNGDGKLDAAVPNATAGVGIMLGNGDGTFAPVTFYRLANEQLSYLAVADLNNDGKLDVAVSAGMGHTAVLQGNGDGTLREPSFRFDIQSFDLAGSIVAADFNNDGRMDLALANGNSNTLSVLLQSPTALSATAVSFGTHKVGTPTTKTVTLTNGSSQALAISGVQIGKRNRSDFTETNDCGSSVAPGASCTFTVTFTPQKAGVRLAALVITDSSSSSPQRVELKGTGD